MPSPIPNTADGSKWSTWVRAHRAAFRVKVKRADDVAFAREMVATLIWLPPRWAAAWLVTDVLDMVPGLQARYIDAALERAGIRDPNKTLYQLTTRQADILAEYVRQTGGKNRA